MNRLKQFYSQEAINTGRQAEVDMLKAVVVVLMVICHTVMGANYEYDSFGYFFADDIIGAMLGGAPAFMLSMGLGIVYSRKNDHKSLFIRGIKLFVLAYVLNFFRWALPALILNPEVFVLNLLWADILHFAGLSFVAIALAKKLNIRNYVVLAIAVVLSATAFLYRDLATGTVWMDCILNLFVPVSDESAAFSFVSWFIFTVAGMWLGDTIIRVRDLDNFYRRLIIPSLLISIVPYYIYWNYAESELDFYGMTFPTALGFIGFSIFMLSVFHFLVKKLSEPILDFIKTASSNITAIYVISWLIIGPVETYLSANEAGLTMCAAYLLSIPVFVVSYYAAILYKKIKRKLHRNIAAAG